MGYAIQEELFILSHMETYQISTRLKTKYFWVLTDRLSPSGGSLAPVAETILEEPYIKIILSFYLDIWGIQAML